jgi:predicted small secreted protein
MKKIITILALLALLASCGANTTPTDNPITIIP